MVRFFCVLWLALPTLAFAAPPEVEVPAKVIGDPGAFVVITAKTDAKNAQFYAIDPGINLFPPGLLTDPKTTVVTAPKGEYRVLVYAGNVDGASAPKIVVVVIGDGKPVPPVKPDPPVTPPPTTAFYFLIVRPDGPASPAFTATMGLPAWGDLKRAGHTFKDKTVSEAAAFGVVLPNGTALPCVVTLDNSGENSKIVRGPVPLPTDSSGIVKLPTEVK